MVSYIYTFRKRMAVKLGRVMTYSEGFLSAKSHDCLCTWSHEITSGSVIYCRGYMYALSTQTAHGFHIWELLLWKKLLYQSKK